MTFPYSFSAIAASLRPSPIRELFRTISRPGMISFAGGWPDPEIFPIAQFASCAEVLAAQGAAALQYGATEGHPALVGYLQGRMEEHLGRPVRSDELIITSGSQQVMDMVARVLLDPGDVVIVEAPTYPGALHTFRAAGARFAVVPADEGGMVVDELPEVIKRCRRETGRAPKLIYSIVNFANPSGACLTRGRRQGLAVIAAQHGIPVLEDDPYGELRWAGEAISPLFSLARDGGVLFASSFSKILAPGTRVAWAVGDSELIRRMAVAKQGMDLCTSMVSQVLVHEYCRRGLLDDHLGKIRAHYAAKATAMAQALEGALPTGAARWSNPEGGFFFWLRLGEGLDGSSLFERALDNGVAFLPGRAFYPSPEETIGDAPDGDRFARLCFTFATPDQIVEGCRRLASAMRPRLA